MSTCHQHGKFVERKQEEDYTNGNHESHTSSTITAVTEAISADFFASFTTLPRSILLTSNSTHLTQRQTISDQKKPVDLRFQLIIETWNGGEEVESIFQKDHEIKHRLQVYL
jgi:hypothetical protein